jgi:CheY-like chemotaxis protein
VRWHPDLMRELLLKVEALPSDGRFHDISFEEHTEEEISHLVMLIDEAGLVGAFEVDDRGIRWKSTSLTDSGREFLDAARSELIWEKAKAWTLMKSGTLTLEELKLTLAQIVGALKTNVLEERHDVRTRRGKNERRSYLTYRHQTIMLVDDDAAIVDITRKILERVGYYVVPFTSGREAVAFCRIQQEFVDLLLTDIEMPRMNGMELARSIAEYKPGVPVLYMTAYDTGPENLPWSRQNLEVASVINKPFPAGILVGRIQEMIARSLTKKVTSFA